METNDLKLDQAPTESNVQKDETQVVETSVPNKKVEQPAVDRETAEEIDKKFGHLREPMV